MSETLFSMYKPRTVYILEPHASCADADNGHIPIDEIASRVYGKRFESLRACQADGDRLPNDSEKLYELTSDAAYEHALSEFENTEVYLGYDRVQKRNVIKYGKTQLEYWLSIKVATEGEQPTVIGKPGAHADLEGEVFADASDANRSYSPSLRAVLADLIRRGELPRADYLYLHWW